ncbi:MAG TPA: S8 family serine peptidase, partial [Steroidobacteraceae bacterium]
MTTKNRARRYIIAVAAIGMLAAPFYMVVRKDPSTTPVVTKESAQQIPATAFAPPPARRVAQPQPPAPAVTVGERSPYIVQAATADIARGAVLKVGGVVTGDLSIIRAVGASLDDRQLMALHAADIPALRIFEDTPVNASSVTGTLPETYYPSEVAAKDLQVGGVTGSGVTVAVLDSGLWAQHGPLQTASNGNNGRILAQYDVLLAQQSPSAYPLFTNYSTNIGDPYGHGTHVSSIIGSSGIATTGNYQGVAPGVNLVSVRVLDGNGQG